MSVQLLTFSCPHCGKIVEADPTSSERILTCPDCQKPFQLEVPTAKPVPKLILPSDATKPAEVHNGQASNVAQAAPVVETELLNIRPEMFKRHPMMYSCLALLTVVGVSGLIYALIAGETVLGLLSLAVGGYGFYRFANWWLRIKTTVLTVTTRRVVLRSGLMTSINVEIPFEEISDVHVTFNLWDRLWTVGDLTILGSKKVINVLGVPDAEAVADQIRGRRIAS